MGPKPAEIAEANADGTLDFPTGSFFWTQPPGPATPGKFVIITMKAKEGIVGTHTVPLTVSDLYMLNADLVEILDADIGRTDGEVVVEGPPPPLPDLIVSDISEAWVEEGKTYNVTFTVKSQGAAAIASTASIEIDGVKKATAAIPALAAGETHTATVGPFTLTGANDTIKVYADKLAVVAELDETNNYLETLWVLPGYPDLIISNLEYECIIPGKTYKVTFTIKNQGDVAAAASTASLEGIPFGPVAFKMPALEPGATLTIDTADHMPQGVSVKWPPVLGAAGRFSYDEDGHTVKVYVDKDGVVDESDETNNYRDVTILPPDLPDVPDLVVIPEGWSVERVEGGQYRVTFTIKNQGEGDAAASTAGIEIDGEEKAAAPVPALAAGKTHTATAGPFTLTNGRDIVKVIADRDNVVAERGGEAANHREWAVEGQKAPWEAPWGIIAGVGAAVVVVGIVVFAVRRRTS
ncbi:hypothetical protein M1O51_01585 [Dehalococcoidia bacterium]|nr:hypothetical protein [Dehalococcoidia bacterium]